MDALKIKLQATRLSMVIRLVQLLSVGLYAGLRQSLLLLKRIYAKNAMLSSSTKQKKYKYPQRQVNQYAVAFEGNVKSYNTETGRITTHKYKGKRV